MLKKPAIFNSVYKMQNYVRVRVWLASFLASGQFS